MLLKTWNLVLNPPKVIQARAKTCGTECSGWPARRFESAAQIILNALKEKKENKFSHGGMSRQEVRDAARLHDGDTEPTPENIAAGHRLVAALFEKIV
ncbi:PHD finger protein MALE MEIOCYTE DEATH [Salix suchowensis]|nr:PHD finger protein MALE MEIOCYTE DEATH [Salix suchowensis]